MTQVISLEDPAAPSIDDRWNNLKGSLPQESSKGIHQERLGGAGASSMRSFR